VGETILAVLLGAGFLHAFYQAAKFQWPSSYYALDNPLGFAITATPVRYIAFRFAPVFIVCLFVTASMRRVDEDPTVAIAGIVLCHIGTTLGRASWGIRGSTTPRRGPLLVLYGAVSVGVAMAAVLGVAFADALDVLVPPVADLSASLWTALFAGVLGIYVLQLSQAERDVQVTLRKSRAEVGDELWEYAAVAAAANDADVSLVRALMLIENVERPPWFRRLERLKGRLFHRGTYGVMQVTSDRPLSDKESIDLAASMRLRGVQVPMQSYEAGAPFPDLVFLQVFARSYNSDDAYEGAIASAYLFGSGIRSGSHSCDDTSGASVPRTRRPSTRQRCHAASASCEVAQGLKSLPSVLGCAIVVASAGHTKGGIDE
jgi:hypothetical protein